MKWGLRILLIASILFLLFGLIVYFSTTTSTTITDNPISITKATYDENSQSIQVVPKSTAKPDVTYSIVMDNSIFKQSFTVSWNPLELAIEKPKTLTNLLSQDEVTAIQRHPSYSITIYRLDHTHPIVWVIIPMLVLFIVCVFAVPRLYRISHSSDIPYTTETNIPLTGATATPEELVPVIDEIGKHIQDALKVIDSTAKWYNNEEEANRELVSCLKSQGLEAVYQFNLGGGTTADAKVGDDVLIEGKLEPNNKRDVDTLIGQLQGYSSHPYRIHVVIYGCLNELALRRINNEINSRYPNKVFLNYLLNPRRVGREG